MIIQDMTPVNLAEVKELMKGRVTKDEDIRGKGMESYLKSFCKADSEKAKAMIEEISKLDNVKLKDETIVKLVDFMPADAEDVHKVANESSLDEAEVNSILEIIRKH